MNIYTNRDFRYFLHNKVLWGNIKKFIGTDESIPERYINSLTWISKNKHWNLLEYKLKRNERLEDIIGFTMDYLWDLFDYTNGDLDIIKTLIQRYHISFDRSQLEHINTAPFTQWTTEKFNQFKFKIADFLEYLVKETHINIYGRAFRFLSMLSVETDCELIDSVFQIHSKKGVFSNIDTLFALKNSKLMVYILSKYKDCFYTLVKRDVNLIDRDFTAPHIQWFKWSVRYNMIPVTKYYLETYEWARNSIDIVLICTATSEEMFDLLMGIYKSLHLLSNLSDTEILIERLTSNILELCLEHGDAIYHPKKMEAFLVVIQKSIENNDQLVIDMLKYRNVPIPLLLKLDSQINHTVRLDKYNLNDRINFDTLSEIYPKHFPKRVSMVNSIRFREAGLVRFLISVRKSKFSGYITLCDRQSRGYITAACRGKNNEITSMVLEALIPCDFTFLLKEWKFGHVQYLLENGFKKEADFLDLNNKKDYKKHILRESIKHGNFRIFKMIYYNLSNLVENSLDLAMNPKIIDFLLSNGHKDSKNLVQYCIGSKNPYLFDIVKHHLPDQVKQFLNDTSIFIIHEFYKEDPKRSYQCPSLLDTYKLYKEYGASSNDDEKILLLTSKLKDYQLLEYLTSCVEGPKLNHIKIIDNLLAQVSLSPNSNDLYKNKPLDTFRYVNVLLRPIIGRSDHTDTLIKISIYDILKNYQFTKFYCKYFPELVCKFWNDCKSISNYIHSNDIRPLVLILSTVYPNGRWISDSELSKRIEEVILNSELISHFHGYLTQVLLNLKTIQNTQWPTQVRSENQQLDFFLRIQIIYFTGSQ
ncbi:hypothetical protein DLAC_01309 [Tieghemostelium lacteum]|uniref:Uncharacterized protein n=1 Tax=Tieghemostelium lacteum TaxID=361077 RepID=A0A152A8D6_TIELA|nr:hypothetical protein DLAC_01309 [Tieghemostelium lacteum]|eukprot:KYR02468.1 hypothetical protein DLAC_01309 [Tieghemostelium lacteum]